MENNNFNDSKIKSYGFSFLVFLVLMFFGVSSITMVMWGSAFFGNPNILIWVFVVAFLGLGFVQYISYRFLGLSKSISAIIIFAYSILIQLGVYAGNAFTATFFESLHQLLVKEASGSIAVMTGNAVINPWLVGIVIIITLNIISLIGLFKEE